MPARDEREMRTASEVKAVEEAARIKKDFKKRDEKIPVTRVSHVGIVVRDIYDALSAFDGLFGFVKDVHVENLTEQGVRVAIIVLGGTELEFIQPIQPGTGVAKFLELRGEGLHHVSLEVDDIEETLRNVGSKGAKLIDKEPWHGVRGKTAFIHPSSLHGVLVELDEPNAVSDE